jgi:hypothetical protein
MGISMKGNCQEVIFPMKGNFIYYSFEEVTNNKKHCIKYYCSSIEFKNNVEKKCKNLNVTKFTLVGPKNTMVNFIVPIHMASNTSCIDEFGSPSFFLTLPTGDMLFESNLIFSLITVGKFKVSSQMITATVKLKFESENKYSLIFTNFKIKYTGTQGTKMVTEEINLEEVYSALKEKGKQDNKMYDKSIESMKELDNIIKNCAKIFSEELKRTYEIDEL